MATSTVTSKVARKIALYTSGKESLKGEVLSATSSFWFLLFLLLPMVIVVIFGLATINTDLTISYNKVTFDNYISALNPFGTVPRLTIRTLIVSVVAAIGALVASYPIAYYLARVCSEKNRGILVNLVVVPFWISFVVQVYAIEPWVQKQGYFWLLFNQIGLSGFADWLVDNFGLGSPNIVAPALIYIWLPFMILPLFTALLRIDPVLIEAAQDLGAGKWKAFWNVTFPLSYSGVVTGTILIFITAFGSFVEPKILAGQSGTLVGNYIYDKFLKFGELPNGAAASVVVLVPTIVLLYFYVVYAEAAGSEFRRRSRVIDGVLAVRDRLLEIWRRRFARRPAPSMGNGGSVNMHVVRGALERKYDELAAKHGKLILALYTGLALAAFYVPLAQVVVFSFNHDNNIISWSYPSLRWYVPEARGATEVRSLFADPDMVGALWNSLGIGLAVTLLSLTIGIPAAMAIVRYRYGTKPFLNLMLYTGLVMPSIIMGVSILVFITFLNDLYLGPYFHTQWPLGYSSIIVGHVTFCIPIVIVVMIVSLREFDRSIEEAAMNLGADEITTFFRVTVPNIMPGIISAALLSFTFSFSEVIVTDFLKGNGVETLPVVFWATLSKKIPTPELNAASALILGLSAIFVLVSNRIQKGSTGFRF